MFWKSLTLDICMLLSLSFWLAMRSSINLRLFHKTICYNNTFRIVQQVYSRTSPLLCPCVISRHCAWAYISIYYLYVLKCAHAATPCIVFSKPGGLWYGIFYFKWVTAATSLAIVYCESKSLKKHPCYRHETLHSGYDIHILRTLDVRVSGLLANCLKPSTSHHPRCRLWQFNSLGPNTTSYWKGVYDLHVISSKCCHHLSLFTQLFDPLTFTDKHYSAKQQRKSPR